MQSVFIVSLAVVISGCSSESSKDNLTNIQAANVGDSNILAVATGEDDKRRIEGTWDSETGRKTKVWSDQLHKAREYERVKNFMMAELEYKRAIELSPHETDQGVARMALADIYEATEQYAQALEQVDWLLSRDLRKDVLDRLHERKKKIEMHLSNQ